MLLQLITKTIQLACFMMAPFAAIHAQVNVAETIREQLNQYTQTSLQEKLFVHTDKTTYVAGEILWFKVYAVDGYLNQPLDMSKVAYVEILSDDSKPLLQAKIALQDGHGNGSFMLPFSINSGNFKLRAYTNWMKNFSPDFYFEQPITIVNTLRKPAWKAQESAEGFDIQFLPEGGSLVDGIAGKVAFKAIDRYGKGIHCTGSIVDEANAVVIQFETLAFGMGHFLFTPAKIHTYKAIIKLDNGQSITQNLPEVASKGYSMNLSAANDDHIAISVQTNIMASPAIVYLLAHTRQSKVLALAQQIIGGKAVFTIDKNQVGEGVTHFTIFDNEKRPVCERLYFKPPSKRLELGIAQAKQVYGTREKVNLDLTTKNETGSQVSADLSLAVTALDSLQAFEPKDILSYLWLSSDLKGHIESPAYYFSNDKRAEEGADNLMLTQGWSRFVWQDVLQQKSATFDFTPEYDGHIIEGSITNKKNGQPAANILSYLTVPKERFQLGSATSNANGRIRFDIKGFYGGSDIILQTSQADSMYRIDITNPFSEKFSSTYIPALFLAPKWQAQLTSLSIGTQTQHTYQPEKWQHFFLPENSDSNAFYGNPDKKYFLDDYTRFVTMEEVMREYVKEVRLRKNNDKFHFRVENTQYGTGLYFDVDPLVLLDGLPVFDINKLIAFDPLKIKKVEIMTRNFYTGKTVNAGIISYTTYQGDLGGFPLDPQSLVLEYPGMQLRREFYSPIYETALQKKSRFPDFRATLLWSPDAATDETGKRALEFYTSDLAGKYAIIVQGITNSGLAGFGVATLTVSK